jgi:opacity protein-like surface antigen
MNLRNALLTLGCLLTLGLSQASAQGTSRWVTGQTGFTPGSSSWLVAGEAGGRFNPIVGIYGSFGHMADASPKELKQMAASMGSTLGVAVPTTYGIGGVKLFAPAGTVKPYGLAGLGYARTNPRYSVSGVDITRQVESLVGPTSASGRVLEFGAGVEIGGPIVLDLGYRVMRFGGDYSIGRLQAAVGIGF